MKATIVGWYGTETIGDRAILAGIIVDLAAVFGSSLEVHLGSLYPFFSERTLNEDLGFLKIITGLSDLKINLFDSKDDKALEAAINNSQLMIMGGGPLMDLNALYMVEYAFKRSRKKGVKTMIYGCGVGPLFKRRHQRTVGNIAATSDVIVLRDSASKAELLRLSPKLDANKINTSLDPAVRCVLSYQELPKRSVEPYIAINLRHFPEEYSQDPQATTVNQHISAFVKAIAETNDKAIKLIPMHYFHVGNDDRDFLNDMAIRMEQENVSVQNVPLTLEETIRAFELADWCVGMRFHSVVLQTVVNGRNAVLDYTQPGKGKIAGFLKDMNAMDVYTDRYVNLQELKAPITIKTDSTYQQFSVDKNVLESKLSVYREQLKTLL